MVFVRALDAARLLPGRALGLRLLLRRATRAAGWPTGSALVDFAGGTAVEINAGAVRPGARDRPGPADRLRQGPDAAAQPAAGDARRRPAVVRLVRLQRRLGARCQPGRPRSSSSPRWSPAPPGALGWLVVERFRDGHADVARCRVRRWSPAWSRSRRPAARSSPLGAIVMGAAAGVVCALAVGLKYRFGYDDSLDVVGVHLVGGLVGTLGIGLLATAAAHRCRRPVLRRRGRPARQAGCSAAASVLVYAFVVTGILGLVVEQAHRLPDRRGARGQRHRPRRARRDRLRPARDRAAPARRGHGVLSGITAGTQRERNDVHEAGHRGHQAAQVGGRPGRARDRRRHRA